MTALKNTPKKIKGLALPDRAHARLDQFVD